VTGSHYNDYWSTVTRRSFNTAQRHVTAFRPISEAARSWSCDKSFCPSFVTPQPQTAKVKEQMDDNVTNLYRQLGKQQ